MSIKILFNYVFDRSTLFSAKINQFIIANLQLFGEDMSMTNHQLKLKTERVKTKNKVKILKMYIK